MRSTTRVCAPRATSTVRVSDAKPSASAITTWRPGSTSTDSLARAATPSIITRAEPSGAVVRIDGQTVGFGLIEETVRPGTHSLDVSAPGYTPLRRSFEALAGQSQTIRATLSSNRGVAESPWFWIGVSAVAAGAGVAAWFLLQDLAPPYQGTLGTVTDAVHLGGWR